MNEVYIRKDELNSWIAKYFKKDLISIADLIGAIEDLDGEVEHLQEQLEDMEQNIEDNYVSRWGSPYSEYGVRESDFH